MEQNTMNFDVPRFQRYLKPGTIIKSKNLDLYWLVLKVDSRHDSSWLITWLKSDGKLVEILIDASWICSWDSWDLVWIPE